MEHWLATEDEILELVDEFSLYCYYLGFVPELRTKYRSPLRDRTNPDDNPSFSMFAPTKVTDRDFLWKDSGGVGRAGDIFSLVQHLFKYKTRASAVQRVRMDFLISRQELAIQVPPPSEPARIKIKSKPFSSAELEFWKGFGIPPTQLARYRTSSISCYWLLESQLTPSYPTRMGFAYHIYDKYQLYFPFRDPGKKFRHDTGEMHVPGLEQLSFKRPKLLITKSYKDLMLLDRFGEHFNYEVVAVRSENTPFPDVVNAGLRERYREIYTWFDNDGKCRRDFFDYATGHLEVPLSSGQKDPSDFYKAYKEDAFVGLLNDLLC